jgi:ElaB/YqjD/DUF883 family membrane-anchored ribosome-binding protein
MKKVIIPILVASSMLLLTSCAMLSSKGKAAAAEERGRNRIANVDSKLNANVVEKMDAIASLAYGTDYALSKITDPSREVQIARDMNKRVESLAGSPTLDQMKDMQSTIDKLTSMLASERNEGKQKLSEKDQIISNLQNETKALNAAKETEIHKYMQLAQDAAEAADAYKVELDKMNRWFGLGAVFYGLKKFIISSMWILGIGGILFIILRLMSYSNPVVASIFSIFSTIASWVIRGIEALVPKAIEFAGHTANAVVNVYKSTLWKIVDNIQVVKDRAAARGEKPNLDEVLDEVAKSMNSDEKAIVEEIKKALHWK